jgi:hypothetical protein
MVAKKKAGSKKTPATRSTARPKSAKAPVTKAAATGTKRPSTKPAATASAKKRVSSSSAAAELRDYHKRRVWDDVQRLPVDVVPLDHPVEEFRGLGFFTSLAEMELAKARRPLFTVCLYFESLLDQGLHQFFPPELHA